MYSTLIHSEFSRLQSIRNNEQIFTLSLGLLAISLSIYIQNTHKHTSLNNARFRTMYIMRLGADIYVRKIQTFNSKFLHPNLNTKRNQILLKRLRMNNTDDEHITLKRFAQPFLL